MARSTETEAHDLTVTVITDLIGGYRRDRRAALDELITIEKRRHQGDVERDDVTDLTREVRARAKQLVNGYAAADWALPPTMSREKQLRVEIEAIDLVIAALGEREVRQRSIEAMEREVTLLPKWKQSVRKRLRLAVQMCAADDEGMALKASHTPFSLPLDEFLGHSSVLPGVFWDRDPLATRLKAAVDEGYVTEREIKEWKEAAR
jgi:hypothetical protein